MKKKNGSLFNANEIANTLGISAETVREYTYLLRKSFIVGEISPFHTNVRKELTKMPKLYMLDSGFRNIVVNDFRAAPERRDKGEILENRVYISLRMQRTEPFYYWRTQDKKEIDFVIPDEYALETKWSVSQFNAKKHTTFTEAYPSIPLYPVVCRDDSFPELLDLLY